jgi:predicted enzyme related to lactoylglutathione lyase
MVILSAVTFDCADALAQATFWAAVMRWDVAPGATTDVAMVGGPNRPTGAPSMLFFGVPEPKVAKNRNHVDLHTADLEGELRRIIALGASVIHDKHEYDTDWYTLADPEGNEFCLVADPTAPA